ncbi:HERC2, partial [Symbiodinium sp. CCMP2456]
MGQFGRAQPAHDAMDQIVLDESDDGAEAAIPGSPNDALVQAPPVRFASNWWRMLTYAGMTWYCFHSSQPDEWWAVLLKKSVTTAWLRTICGYSTWVATDDA